MRRPWGRVKLPHPRTPSTRGEASASAGAAVAVDPAAALGHALDDLRDVFVLLDEHGTVLAANACAAELCGRTGEPLAGRPFLEVLPAPFATGIRAAVEAVLAHGEPRSFDVRVKDGDGWYAGHAYRTTEGALLHLHNVTARRNSEDALAFLVEAGAALTTVLDEDRLMRTVTRLVVPRLAEWCLVVLRESPEKPCRFHAAATDDGLRRHIAASGEAACAGDGAAAILVQEAMVAETATLLTRETCPESLRRCDLWNRDDTVLLCRLAGRTGSIGAIIMGRGPIASPFRRDEISLATTLANRAGLVLENVRLLEAERRATRLRDDVLTIVAHDLRGPLNAIVLGATALPADAISQFEELHQTARRSVLAAADQMNRLLEDLVNAARLDAGWAPRERRGVKVARLLEEVVETFRWRAEKEGIRLSVRAHDADREEVDVDAGRMYEAIGNLLDNALKFTPRGGTVTLEASRAPRGVRISVTDTGSGIDAETLHHLFDRFWQARRSGRAGSGLGLFITRRIVEGHGGRIWAESTVGKGSTFHITLPRGESGAAPDAARPAHGDIAS